MVTQLAMNPVALGMVSAAAGVIAFIPGMPLLPFGVISVGAGTLAWRRSQAALLPEPVEILPSRSGRGADHPDPGHRRDQD
jgi:flagellar biosynthesis protein FlhA